MQDNYLLSIRGYGLMESIENKFTVKRVMKSTDEGYVEALSIYNDTTPVDIKTNSNEITSWLDETSPNSHFKLFVFNLYLDGEIIGFAMLSYLIKRRVLVYDYLALKDPFRLNVAFLAYVSLIFNYFSSEGYKIDYYVTEIGNKNAGKEIDKESIFFRKLLCVEGFGFINAPYQTLPLGVDNYESDFEAWLYIKKSGDVMLSINRDTFLNIVRGIYFDYYETWYSAFLSTADMDCFKEKINLKFEEIEDKTKGIFSFDMIHTSKECFIVLDKRQERTDGSLPAIKKGINRIFPVVLAVLVIAPISIVLCYNWILNMLNVPIGSVSSMIGAIFAAIMTLAIAYLTTRKKDL
jgi:hypothetical protein